jgi:glycolate oxidase iron-sulfur subunit
VNSEPKKLKFSSELLAPCISCGFCLSACPTYQLTKDERSSPRGRISLMREYQSDLLPLNDPTFQEESSFCLGCRACEPVCPANVKYGALLEEWRDLAWTKTKLSIRVRILKTAVRLNPIIKFVGWIRGSAKLSKANIEPNDKYLMLGCAERILFPQVSRAAIKLCPSLKVPNDQGCCGALQAHNGSSDLGRKMASELGVALPGLIVTTSGGCAAHLVGVLGRDRVKEFSEFIVETNSNPILKSSNIKKIMVDGHVARIALQDSCHLRNGLSVFKEPREIISGLGEFYEISTAKVCCGAAGTYSLLRPKDSKKILAPKLKEILESNIDYLVTLNPGCYRQMSKGLRKSGVKVVHISELLDMA